MSDILLKKQYTGNLPDAPEGYSRLMSNEKGALVLIDQDRKETAFVGAVVDPLTGKATGIAASDGSVFNLARGTSILNGANAGTDSGWLAMSDAPERFAYQLDSGTTTTTFSVDISADGVNSLGQAFTGTWASSTLAEITPPIMFSSPLAKFFRWNVLSGGPLSVSRGV